MNEEKIRNKLENGTITDIKDIYYGHFHEIKHTESFGILIKRLWREMKKVQAYIKLKKYIDRYRWDEIAKYKLYDKIKKIEEELEID